MRSARKIDKYEGQYSAAGNKEGSNLESEVKVAEGGGTMHNEKRRSNVVKIR